VSSIASPRPEGPLANKRDLTSSAVTVVPTVPTWFQYGGPYFAGLAAVIAAGLAAHVALRGIKASRDNVIDQIIAQRQIAARTARAHVISASRQKWIDGLRDDLAAFIAADFVLLDDSDVDEEKLEPAERIERFKQVATATRDRRMLQRRIQLRLNPDKPHHEALYKAVRVVMPATGNKHRAARSRLIRAAQALLRQEWLRVKSEAGDWAEADNAKSPGEISADHT
jgi:hypothetical protein